ncbi:MAG TPA: OPT family oligopeptide transporter [Kofleriaceae bacterium]
MREGTISIRAIAVGAVFGILFAGAAMYAGQKAGYIDGGNIPAALLAFGALSVVLRRRPSVDDGNIVQTVSSSAAVMAITGGLTGPVAAMSIDAAGGASMPSYVLIIAWGIAVGVVGTLMAIPLRTAFVLRGRLPFPSGMATAEVLEDIYRREGSATSRLRMLAIGGVLAFALAFVRSRLHWIPEMYVLPVVIGGIGAEAIALGVGWSPLLVGVGYLAGARTAIALVIGAVIAWLVIAPQLVSAGIAQPDYMSLLQWLLFAGTGLMLGGAAVSVVAAIRDLRVSLREVSAAGGLAMTRTHVLGLVAGSIGVVAFGTLVFDVNPMFPLFGLVLSAVLCAASVHAMGETDNTPAGPLGGFAQLVIGATAPGGVTSPLSGGGVVNSAVMHASMMVQNWKTGERVGTSPNTQLVAQLVGVAVGAVTCAGVYALLEAAYGIGTEAMPAPAAVSWKATATIASSGISAMPDYAIHGAAIAFVVGSVLSLKPIAKYAPSPVAMGMAFILPPYMSFTMAIGGLLYWVAARRSKKIADEEGVSLASGMIGGEALAGLLIAVLLLWAR